MLMRRNVKFILPCRLTNQNKRVSTDRLKEIKQYHFNTDEAPLSFRFHSFYPWHTSGDYNFLCDQKDMGMLKWIREFNLFDLYTKCPDIPEVDELIPYYTKIVEKYVPGKLKW